MFEIILSVVLLNLIQVSAFAVMGYLFNIGIKEISFGVGKRIFSYDKISIRVFLLSGFVSFIDSRDEFIDKTNLARAFNHQSTIIQLTVALSGAMTVMIVSFSILGISAGEIMKEGFTQIVLGAISPFNKAQEYIGLAEKYTSNLPIIELIGYSGAKLTALNLLPFSIFNGGQAIIILAKLGQSQTSWEEKVTKLLAIPALLIFLSWAIAFIWYAVISIFR